MESGHRARKDTGVKPKTSGSAFVLSFRKSDRRLACFPLATLLEKFDALKAFENGAFSADCGA